VKTFLHWQGVFVSPHFVEAIRTRTKHCSCKRSDLFDWLLVLFGEIHFNTKALPIPLNAFQNLLNSDRYKSRVFLVSESMTPVVCMYELETFLFAFSEDCTWMSIAALASFHWRCHSELPLMTFYKTKFLKYFLKSSSYISIIKSIPYKIS
jgi:hypothetical protein